MRFRSLLLIVGGIAVLGGLMLAGLSVTRPSVPALQVEAPAISEAILVAARPVEKGTLLRAEDMRWMEVGDSSVVPGQIARGNEDEAGYQGAVVTRKFAEGEPFLSSELIRPAERDFLAAVLLPNMRAVTVTADALQSAAGLLLPGDHVDVILTQRFNESDVRLSRQVASETVLRDIRVIAVDQRFNTPTEKPDTDASTIPPGRIPSTITLEVSELNAEKLLVAKELGKLGLALRPLFTEGPVLDDTPATVWGADVSHALSSVCMASSLGKQPSAPPVKVIHGDKKENQ